MNFQNLDKNIIVDESKFSMISAADAIVFDCDGVLIDVKYSYDLAIKKTVDFVLAKLADIKVANIVTTEMIEGFKETGGFNDEVDVTYALILSAIAAEKLGRPFFSFINLVIAKSDQTGIESIERFLSSQQIDLSDIRSKLSYPSERFENPLSNIFDEMFYGQELYSQLYKKKPKFFRGKGLIENDIVLVEKNLLNDLHARFKEKISIVSGRGVLSAKYSLKELFEEFDIKNSKFLEDEPREMAKPNPQPLISSIRGMKASCSIFVGDSMEDYIMAHKANETGNSTIFCGIYGTSRDPEEKLHFFKSNGADIILESIHLLPKTLNLVGV